MKRALVVVLLLVCLVSVPTVQAQENTEPPHLIYAGGTVNVSALSSFVFNWTWWGLNRGIELRLTYTTNDPWLPLRLKVNDTERVIFEHYDYYLTHSWNQSKFPEEEIVWWFTLSNIANESVTVEISLFYDVRPATMIIAAYLLQSCLTVFLIPISIMYIGEFVYYARRKHNISMRRDDKGLEMSG